MTESIDNIELDNKNKEILSNNFDRTNLFQEMIKMKFSVIFFIFLLFYLPLFSSDENSSYILKLKSLEEYPIIKTGQLYYDKYKYYENSINTFVTNTTIPSGLRENISFQFKLSSKPVIRYKYNFSFSGFDYYLKYFSLENSFKLFSSFNFLIK